MVAPNKANSDADTKEKSPLRYMTKAVKEERKDSLNTRQTKAKECTRRKVSRLQQRLREAPPR